MSNIPSHIKAICFDAVGTLIFPEPPAHLVYAEVAQRHGIRLAPDVIRALFSQAFAIEEQRDFDEGLRTSETREMRRWQNIVGTVLHEATDTDACFRELYAHFHRPAAWRCAPDTGEILARLAERWPLALASNYDHRLHAVMAGLPELRPIAHTIISSEVGWRKPAAGFFVAVSTALDLPPEQILYVGDDWRNDYEGAQAAGLTPLLFDPSLRRPEDLSRIGDLGELLASGVL